MRSFFYKADVQYTNLDFQSCRLSVITSQCSPRFFSEVSHFAGRRVFSFPKNSGRAVATCHPDEKKRAKPSSRQHLALILFPIQRNPNVEHKSFEVFLYLSERVLSDKLHRFLWRKINEVSKEMDGKKHRVLPGIKTI